MLLKLALMNWLEENMPINKSIYAPGMRIVVRDAEWVIRRSDMSADGGYLIECEGISELVRGREGRFLTAIENDPDTKVRIIFYTLFLYYINIGIASTF